MPYIKEAIDAEGDKESEKRIKVEKYVYEQLALFMSSTLASHPTRGYVHSVKKVFEALLSPCSYKGALSRSEVLSQLSLPTEKKYLILLDEVQDKMVKATNIVFDFGNVLVDWNPDYLFKDYFQDPEAYSSFRERVLTPEWMAAVDASESLDELISSRIEAFPDYKEALELFRDDWQKMIPGEIPGMKELVQDLKAAGYGIFGLSNWCKVEFEKSRTRFEVLRLIDNYLISGGLRDSEGKLCKPKPSPDMFNVLFQRYQLDPKTCVYIDDKQANVDTGSEFGMRSLLFPGPAALRRLFF